MGKILVLDNTKALRVVDVKENISVDAIYDVVKKRTKPRLVRTLINQF